MSLTALLLVLLSAVNHASWNLVMKSSRDKYAFTWWMLAGGFLLTLPALFLLPVRFTPASVALLAASIVAEGLYMLTLSASYQRLDYTVVYPVARGSAPVFIAVGAAVLLGERVSPAGVAGILLVSVGVLSLQGRNVLRADMRRLGLPLACGAWIASFSLANKAAVGYFSPLAMVCLIFGGTALLLWPYVVWVRRVDLVEEFRRQRLRVLVIALLSSAGFAAVLAAMRLAPGQLRGCGAGVEHHSCRSAGLASAARGIRAAPPARLRCYLPRNPLPGPGPLGLSLRTAPLQLAVDRSRCCAYDFLSPADLERRRG